LLSLLARLYNKVFERVFPGRGIKAVVMKVLGANVIGDPVFFFPTFYTMREVASTGTVSMDCVRNGLAKYSANYWNDWVNSWSIWIPGYCVKSVLLLLIRALLLWWRSEVPVC
jgi:hypothetical protein